MVKQPKKKNKNKWFYDRHCVCVCFRMCTNQKTFIEMNIYETKQNNALSNAVTVCVWIYTLQQILLGSKQSFMFCSAFYGSAASYCMDEKMSKRWNNVDTGVEFSLKQITCCIVVLEWKLWQFVDAWISCTEFNMLGKKTIASQNAANTHTHILLLYGAAIGISHAHKMANDPWVNM